MVDQAIDITRSDLAVLYLHDDPEKRESDLLRYYQRGRHTVPEMLAGDGELATFAAECGDSVVLLERKRSPFAEVLLNRDMQSGIALPVSSQNVHFGLLILNSREPLFYNRRRFRFLDSFNSLATRMLQNSELFRALKENLRKIESLQRYQESIFSSMTNLLITTDRNGQIHYFNEAAQKKLGLNQEHLGLVLDDVLKKGLNRKVFNSIRRVAANRQELLGIEGIFRRPEGDMDFSLNVSPLSGKRGADEGLTLLFTDQTSERELKSRVDIAVEERRVIKDMFARYMSQEVVQNLMEAPDRVKLGGAKRMATVFFADIRGYTSFSEGKDPQYIIKVLNDYFSAAVEIVINHHGYIDKFIGDCIMAAWGVPLQSEAEDAFHAVSCALEIQNLVASQKRKFFHGDAEHLRIGIGMHTGTLVAGNLGSSRRMDYSVIGDTVNVAARLEGVAGAGDVIITQNTTDLIGDAFKLEKMKPVSVKGKSEPIPIYRVLDKAS
ncbi:MAG: PAS domain S-box protein [Spirochaetales bacterium]|nr:PAS domain S-box protein [Spirochaetales bacterium]